ncbi:hypothetical protein FJZ31_41990 [Candidatus Poribacteria bacterium]|nr:hypothetical protein [Candidatus Poribacteria bacterium]
MNSKIHHLSSFIFISLVCLIAVGCGGKLNGVKYQESDPNSMRVRLQGLTSGNMTAYASLYPRESEIPEQKFKLETKVTEYKGDGLYDFLNGGAELYFAYDIIAAASAEYKAGQNSIIEVAIYDMGISANAFGMYSTGRYANAEYVSIGNEGIKTSSTLDFWKGRYYCKLVSFDETIESQQAMVALGNMLANNIEEAGTLPELLSLLPEASKMPQSEKYFRKQLALNNIHYVDNENVLQLGEQTEGVVAKYQFGETKVDGFVIKYPYSENADAAYDSYLTYLSRKGKVEKMETENSAKVVLQDGKVTFIAHRDNYLIGVWDAQGEKDFEFVKKTLAKIVDK